MSRNRASAKAAGRNWERAICVYLTTRGWPHAERRRQAGAADRGDVAGIAGVVIEAKNTKGYDLAAAVDEAEVEAANAAGVRRRRLDQAQGPHRPRARVRRDDRAHLHRPTAMGGLPVRKRQDRTYPYIYAGYDPDDDLPHGRWVPDHRGILRWHPATTTVKDARR